MGNIGAIFLLRQRITPKVFDKYFVYDTSHGAEKAF
jgi:hypothetical protein